MTSHTYQHYLRARANEGHSFLRVALPYLLVVGLGGPLAIAWALTSSGLPAPLTLGGSWFWLLGMFGLCASGYVAAQMWPERPKSPAEWTSSQELNDHIRAQLGNGTRTASSSLFLL
jgi:hypothetical protein